MAWASCIAVDPTADRRSATRCIIPRRTSAPPATMMRATARPPGHRLVLVAIAAPTQSTDRNFPAHRQAAAVARFGIEKIGHHCEVRLAQAKSDSHENVLEFLHAWSATDLQVQILGSRFT